MTRHRQAPPKPLALRLYHGTSRNDVDKIKQEGLKLTANVMFAAKWYMLATDYASALHHAKGTGGKVVIEYLIPMGKGRWPGYPYLWPGVDHEWEGAPSTWYGIRTPIPGRFITAVHEVSSP